MDGSGLLGGGAVPAPPPGAAPSVFDRSAAAETSDGARHAAAQLHALTRKNALILLRRRRSTLAYVALPSLAILGLWALEAGVRAWLTGHPGALEDGSGAPLAPLAVRPCRVFAGLPPFAAADASRTTVGRNRFPCSSKKCCATRVRTGLSLPTSSRSDPSSGRSWDETSANGSGRSPGGSEPIATRSPERALLVCSSDRTNPHKDRRVV